MSRYTPRQSAEFEDRQGCFEFGEACRFVAATVFDVKKAITSWVKGFFAKANTAKKPHQLVLELDGIAQVPMVFVM
ncbi:hypothetical protein [uncultured Dechloromonas sp.]|uniref:hypothetical protein n=1 Tax=uncultured Dechloromonas sp. TaxID=171719 RepID=UPI0025EED66E|nr:hypothetical protein [uncultured Dechloromonas sp.]